MAKALRFCTVVLKDGNDSMRRPFRAGTRYGLSLALIVALGFADRSGGSAAAPVSCREAATAWDSSVQQYSDYGRHVISLRQTIQEARFPRPGAVFVGTIPTSLGDAVNVRPQITEDALTEFAPADQRLRDLNGDLDAFSVEMRLHEVLDAPGGTWSKVHDGSEYIIGFFDARVTQPSDAWEHSFGKLTLQMDRDYKRAVQAMASRYELKCPGQPGLKAPTVDISTAPWGEVPILFNDQHVYAKPDHLRQNRLLAALVVGNTPLGPFRLMLQQMGATVSYDPASHTVGVSKRGVSVKFVVGQAEAIVNDVPRTVEAPAEIRDGSIVVPLRLIAERMGAYVDWVPDRRLVVLRDREVASWPAPTEGSFTFRFSSLVVHTSRSTGWFWNPDYDIDFAGLGVYSNHVSDDEPIEDEQVAALGETRNWQNSVSDPKLSIRIDNVSKSMKVDIVMVLTQYGNETSAGEGLTRIALHKIRQMGETGFQFDPHTHYWPGTGQCDDVIAAGVFHTDGSQLLRNTEASKAYYILNGSKFFSEPPAFPGWSCRKSDYDVTLDVERNK